MLRLLSRRSLITNVSETVLAAGSSKSAIIDKSGTYSYQDVLNRARAVASCLPSNVKQGDRLCFMVEFRVFLSRPRKSPS